MSHLGNKASKRLRTGSRTTHSDKQKGRTNAKNEKKKPRTNRANEKRSHVTITTVK